MAAAEPYFRNEGLPQRLCEIPLEYVRDALRWLLEHERVRGRRVWLHGRSRGGS